MPKLFSVAKVGLFLDGYSPGTEKRRGEVEKVVNLTLRVQPFDAKLAIAIDDGLGGDTNVRALLFQLTTTDPKPHLERVQVGLGCPRQTLHIFAAPDTDDARLVLSQVKITGTYARTQKDLNGYAFVFKASVGPVGRDDLEFIHHWYGNQQFVTFEEAEPGLFDEDEDTEGDGVDVAPINGRPTPMWDDGDEPATPVEEPESVREIGATPAKKRGTKKKAGKHNPDAERAAQVKAGKGKANGALHA
jgi:hypothetical protein